MLCVVCVMSVQSQENKNIYVQKKAISIITEKGPINRYKLAVLLGMNPRKYQAFHPFLVEAYDHVIKYDTETKLWNRANEPVSSL